METKKNAENRPIKNIQDLAKQTLSLMDNKTEGPVKEMPNEDKEWLKEALETYSLDMSQVLIPKWEYIKEKLYMTKSEDFDDETYEEMELIMELCEDINFGDVFFCIGGLNDLIRLITVTSTYDRIQSLKFCLNFLKICLHNNSLCQTKARERSRLAEILLTKLSNENLYNEVPVIFYAYLDVFSSYMSGSSENWEDLKSHPLLKTLFDTCAKILFVKKDHGPKNNVIRFYMQILFLEMNEFAEILYREGYISNMIAMIDEMVLSSEASSSLVFCLKFLSLILTR